jgi:hypothetical protein
MAQLEAFQSCVHHLWSACASNKRSNAFVACSLAYCWITWVSDSHHVVCQCAGVMCIFRLPCSSRTVFRSRPSPRKQMQVRFVNVFASARQAVEKVDSQSTGYVCRIDLPGERVAGGETRDGMHSSTHSTLILRCCIIVMGPNAACVGLCVLLQLV